MIAIHFTGIVTRTCRSNDTWAPPNLLQCKTTRLTSFLKQVDILNIVETVQCTTRVLLDILEITINIINTISTTNPILPSDICVIVEILETILRSVAVCKYISSQY